MNIIKKFYVIDSRRYKRIKIIYECDQCHQPNETHKDNLRGRQMAICKTCRNKQSGIKKRGIPSKKRGRMQPRGKDAPNWRGGRYINKQGYVMVSVKQGSINRKSGWENYRPEHIVKIEQKLGRSLTKKECVHHKDGDRQNNNDMNLALIPTNSHHRITHHSLQKIGYYLYKEGKIIFDDNTFTYKWIL